MGIFACETELISSIPPSKMFKAFVLDADTLIQIAPHAIKSIEIIQGNGSVGTIKKITFGEGSPFNYVKHSIDGLDIENCTYSYRVIEDDDALMGRLEKICYELKLEASSDGGSVCKNSICIIQ